MYIQCDIIAAAGIYKWLSLTTDTHTHTLVTRMGKKRARKRRLSFLYSIYPMLHAVVFCLPSLPFPPLFLPFIMRQTCRGNNIPSSSPPASTHSAEETPDLFQAENKPVVGRKKSNIFFFFKSSRAVEEEVQHEAFLVLEAKGFVAVFPSLSTARESSYESLTSTVIALHKS